MLEAGVVLILSLAGFIFGYSKLQTDVKNNKAISDERHRFTVKEIDTLKKHLDDNNEILSELKNTLTELKTDSKYIREALKELKDKQ